MSGATYAGSWTIDDVHTFPLQTTGNAGELLDADAVPSYWVQEDEITTEVASGTFALINAGVLTGAYTEELTFADPPYELGKSYSMFVQWKVGGVQYGCCFQWQMEAQVDVATISAATLSLADIVNGILDEDIVAAHGGADTVGLLLRVLGAAISNRGNNPTLNALLGVADAAGVDVAEQIWAELGTATVQQAPPDSPAFGAALMQLYDAAVHEVDVTATLKSFKDGAGVVIWKKTLSDVAGTYTEAESVSGP